VPEGVQVALVWGGRFAVDWASCYNLRDLGGLPIRGGGHTAWGALIRGDTPDRLATSGWSALSRYGVRTIIDLRQGSERSLHVAGRPSDLTTVHLPLDDLGDTEFWRQWAGGLDCTPLYYRAFLDRYPDRIARVMARMADAPAGGVLVHCAGGRDRTGLIIVLLLALVGVPAPEIAADYALSGERLAPLWLERGLGDQGGQIEAIIARHGTTASASITGLLASLDVPRYLRGAGVTGDQLESILARPRRYRAGGAVSLSGS